MPKQYDVIIIGAGAAGLMCAIEANKHGKKVVILEKENKVAKKILISGGGRCNFTNLEISPQNYLSQNPHFCKSALAQYSQWDFMALMEKHNLTWNKKNTSQLFCDQKSGAIVEMLLDECKADIKTNCIVEKISSDFSITTNQGLFQAKSLVIASGGSSIPKMGATDFALTIAKQFGLKVIEFTAGLVPFVFANHCFQNLSGTAFEVEVSCNGTSFRENLLITHQGLSGPAILQISSYWHKSDEIIINLLPDINAENYLLEQQQNNPKIFLKTALMNFLPKKFASLIIEVGSELRELTLANIKQTDLKAFAYKLNNFTITPDKTQGFRTAEVCLGGVDTNELSSKTMMSKKVNGLYFIGESVDVTGHLGGYNFQWAWSSGFVAGQNV
jgi:predicted Rossmann fold flavoprotein